MEDIEMLVVSPDRFLRQKCSDTPSPCVSPDPQGSCAVPFVSADRAAVATQSRCRDGQEPALVRRIGASIARWVSLPTSRILYSVVKNKDTLKYAARATPVNPYCVF